MKVLLPVDGSHCTKRMLSYIATHDELLGPGHEYLAFTAIPAIPAIPAYATHLLERKTMQGYYQEEADKVLAPVMAFGPAELDNSRAAWPWPCRRSDRCDRGEGTRRADRDGRARSLIAGQRRPRVGGDRRAGAQHGAGAVDPLNR